MVKKRNGENFPGDQHDTSQKNACGPESCGMETPPDPDMVADESFQQDDTLAGKEQADEWKDKYVRLSAEFDNFRRRTLREKMELVAQGGEEIVKALLPVLDDTDRALEAMRKTEDIESVRVGIELISTKLHDTLKSKGLAAIEAIGKELDTDYHEAIARIPAQEPGQSGKIVDVVQKGYKFKDKVARHAKVVVGE